VQAREGRRVVVSQALGSVDVFPRRAAEADVQQQVKAGRQMAEALA
jgi:hypothetical protein